MAESIAGRRIPKRARCAIYTRKSTEEGLEQDFNSLDAQREACAAFIQSQKHEGWTALTSLYDDGGYSGGSMERPALQRLMADIEAGRIDVVVVYKVDRLTRALSDFAKIVEIFDRCGVSFVSITQQFNTTTSMGRLTLNILLSFAQFERELIGERVRDKIAASRKKGLWMGGTVPLGYDIQDRKLIVNKAEARTVVDIYERYLRLKSVKALRAGLDAEDIRSKRRRFADGSERGGQKFSQGALYLMLQNRTYRGEATHKGNAYPGEHAAIIDQPLWDAVQALLNANRVARTTATNTESPNLLTGILFYEAGERMTPSWSLKKGKRYRYYVSRPLLKGGASTATAGGRLPAGAIEDIVQGRIRQFLNNPEELLTVTDGQTSKRRGQGQLIQRGGQIAEEMDAVAEKANAVIANLVRRVIVHHDRIDLEISQDRLMLLLGSSTIDAAIEINQPAACDGQTVTLTATAQLKRVGREMKLVLGEGTDNRAPDASLLRIIARAHAIWDRLAQDTTLTVHDIARNENVTAAYIYVLLRLRWLAPDITTAIVEGRQPQTLSAQKLMRMTAHLPTDWAEQRALFGFR